MRDLFLNAKMHFNCFEHEQLNIEGINTHSHLTVKKKWGKITTVNYFQQSQMPLKKLSFEKP